jgi:hypothetical protein
MPRRGRSLRQTHGESDTVGVQDVVMLEDFRSEDAFIANLRQRFQQDLIYTYGTASLYCWCALVSRGLWQLYWQRLRLSQPVSST